MPLSVLLLWSSLSRADDSVKPAPPSTEETLVASPSSAKFTIATLAGLPKGVENGPIGLDPKTGGATGYAKIPAGATIAMHWHTHAEYSVLLAGKASLNLDGKVHVVQPGSYVVIPGKVHHELTCEKGADCLLLTRRGGPIDYNWVK
jgi:quercetin dioxygenase-like cupin family protein